MSHYKEYQMGIIDEMEFRHACSIEFADDDDWDDVSEDEEDDAED